MLFSFRFDFMYFRKYINNRNERKRNLNAWIYGCRAFFDFHNLGLRFAYFFIKQPMFVIRIHSGRLQGCQFIFNIHIRFCGTIIFLYIQIEPRMFPRNSQSSGECAEYADKYKKPFFIGYQERQNGQQTGKRQWRNIYWFTVIDSAVRRILE